MAKVKIQGNASGTGVVTLTAPNTNADRIITLPDGTGELLAKDSAGRVTMPYQPAFHARNLAGGHAYGDVFPITWSSEEYDTGNNWTGSRFTAPITGKYSFSLQIMYKHVGGDWMLNTYKNGSVYGRNNDWQLSSNGNPWVSNSSTDIIHLNAGDYMEWGVATSGNTGSHMYGVGNYTRISGYLLG